MDHARSRLAELANKPRGARPSPSAQTNAYALRPAACALDGQLLLRCADELKAMARQLGTILQLAAMLANPEAHNKRRSRRQRNVQQLAAAPEVGDRAASPPTQLSEDEQAELAAEIAATLEGRDSPWSWNEEEQQGELVVSGLLLTAPEHDFYVMQLRLLSGEVEAARGSSRPDFVGLAFAVPETKPAATEGASCVPNSPFLLPAPIMMPWQSHEPLSLCVQSPTSVQEDWEHPWLSASPPRASHLQARIFFSQRLI
jgi:hypothetical protein